ncbi:ash family protein [Klebsiella variicola subsp. variicola]|nr:ash family protein [Klebsiella variicola subsp. variicola]
MVGWAGQPKGWPVSLVRRYCEPVQSITIEFRSSGDGCNTTRTRRLPHGYYPYPKSAIYLDYRRCSP